MNDTYISFPSVGSSISRSPSSAAARETDALLETEVVGRYHHQQQEQQAEEDISSLPANEVAKREFKILLEHSWPIVLTFILQNSLQLASLVPLGYLGPIGKGLCRRMLASMISWSV